MRKRALGNTGFVVSAVIYGGIVSMRDGQQASDLYVSWAIERGVNYFDVAPTYGDAQEKLGNSLRPHRGGVYLACKTEQRLRAQAEPALRESLRLLHTDWFDVYQLHALTTMDDVEQAFGKGGVMELVDEAKRQGTIRKVGISAHSEAVARRAMSMYDFDTVLFPLNWALAMGKGFGVGLSADAKERGMGLLALKSMIHRAWLTPAEKEASRYAKSWCKPFDPSQERLALAAIRYTLSLGADAIVPPGDFEHFSFAVEHIEECLASPLDDADRALLEAELPAVRAHMIF